MGLIDDYTTTRSCASSLPHDMLDRYNQLQGKSIFKWGGSGASLRLGAVTISGGGISWTKCSSIAQWPDKAATAPALYGPSSRAWATTSSIMPDRGSGTHSRSYQLRRRLAQPVSPPRPLFRIRSAGARKCAGDAQYRGLTAIWTKKMAKGSYSWQHAAGHRHLHLRHGQPGG